MGGSSKGKQQPTSSPYEGAQARIAEETYKNTAPVRDTLLLQMEDFLKGGLDPSKSPLYAPMYANSRSGLEAQYNVAKDNIMGSTPRGGGQTSALTGLESDRAGNIGNAQNNVLTSIFNDILQKTYGVAFNAPQQSMAGLGQAGSSYASRYGAANQAYSSQYESNQATARSIGESASSTVICTELYRQGLVSFQFSKIGMVFGQVAGSDIYMGYRIMADPIVERMRKSKRFTKFVAFFAIPTMREMARQLGIEDKGSLMGRVIIFVGMSLCRLAYRKDSERTGAEVT
jgi:hypothetical protein